MGALFLEPVAQGAGDDVPAQIVRVGCRAAGGAGQRIRAVHGQSVSMKWRCATQSISGLGRNLRAAMLAHVIAAGVARLTRFESASG